MIAVNVSDGIKNICIEGWQVQYDRVAVYIILRGTPLSSGGHFNQQRRQESPSARGHITMYRRNPVAVLSIDHCRASGRQRPWILEDKTSTCTVVGWAKSDWWTPECMNSEQYSTHNRTCMCFEPPTKPCSSSQGLTYFTKLLANLKNRQ